MQSLPTKTGNCKKCEGQVTIGIGQCVTQCKNCHTTVLFVCHIINKKTNKKPIVHCEQCKKNYMIINCPKCHGYAAIENFMSGFAFQCSCNHKATYVLCNKCENLLALPVQRNFETTKITCKSCKNAFRYKICSSCRMCIYNEGKDSTNVFICTNNQCVQSGSGRNKFSQNNANSKEFNNEEIMKELDNRVNEFQRATIRASQQPESKTQKDICKVCQDKQAIMINTECFHLALCQQCADSIVKKHEGLCPICRAKGQYKKVYKP